MSENDQKQQEWENRTYNFYIQFGKYILLALSGLGLFILSLHLIRGI